MHKYVRTPVRCGLIGLCGALAMSCGDSAGTRIVFQSNRTGSEQVFTMTLRGKRIEQLTNPMFDNLFGSLSEDGNKLVYTSPRNGNQDLYLLDLESMDEVRLTTDPAADFRGMVNRGGTKVAFVSDRDGNREVYVMNVDGTGTVTRLTNDDAEDTMPNFSADDSLITFTRFRNGIGQIYQVEIDGSDETPLTDGIDSACCSSFSKDGSTLLFARRVGTLFEIYTLNLATSELSRVGGVEGASSGHPSYNPDENRIVFSANVDGNSEIYSMRIDGAHLTNLTNDPASDNKMATLLAP